MKIFLSVVHFRPRYPDEERIGNSALLHLGKQPVLMEPPKFFMMRGICQIFAIVHFLACFPDPL
ncbi:hypothetical protein KTQ42_15550|uniref:hypothetical protein n=1 Tax=Noviherbaspirillum sp. L7-7A TaxID=2850560 RepID=UPI001C2BE119|nr:hypothetical protein [Noviherbaspirillum sp. L7-7A]MBV0880716.1 hypothetical protein [Noviherbaspirillum sp. L7-7A]